MNREEMIDVVKEIRTAGDDIQINAYCLLRVLQGKEPNMVLCEGKYLTLLEQTKEILEKLRAVADNLDEIHMLKWRIANIEGFIDLLEGNAMMHKNYSIKLVTLKKRLAKLEAEK